MGITKTSVQPKIWQNGQYITPLKDSKGYYYTDSNGKRVDLNKPLLSFSSEPFSGWIKQTKKHMEERSAENALLEDAITGFQKKYKEMQKELNEYLQSLGLENTIDCQVSDAQQSKISDFEYKMSKNRHSKNRAEMTIRGNLLSNFMDSCDLMKWA